MVSDEKRYEYVTSQVEYFSGRIAQTFKWYAMLAVAILGGYVWVHTQDSEPAKALAKDLAPDLIFLLGAFSVGLIWFDFVRWFGYRRAESALLEHKIDKPSFPGSAWQEIIMTIAIAGFGAAAMLKLR